MQQYNIFTRCKNNLSFVIGLLKRIKKTMIISQLGDFADIREHNPKIDQKI